MSHSPPYKDRLDRPWDCRLVMKVVLKHIYTTVLSLVHQNLQQCHLALYVLEKKYTELYTGSFHVRNHLVSNHCHLKIKWLHNVISETKVRWGGSKVMVEETWTEISWVKRKVYECLKKSSEWEKLTKKEHFNWTLLI